MHTSAQLPFEVAHPPAASHVATQHSFVEPAAQVVAVDVQAHSSHAPAPSQLLVQVAG